MRAKNPIRAREFAALIEQCLNSLYANSISEQARAALKSMPRDTIHSAMKAMNGYEGSPWWDMKAGNVDWPAVDMKLAEYEDMKADDTA